MHELGYGVTVVHSLGLLLVGAESFTVAPEVIVNPPPFLQLLGELQVEMIVTPSSPLGVHPAVANWTVAPAPTENEAPLGASPSR
jgi:hypothetical protein